eukprot:scaffold64784_cov15-Prasinocladus_malaysianus.AAC.1
MRHVICRTSEAAALSALSSVLLAGIHPERPVPKAAGGGSSKAQAGRRAGCGPHGRSEEDSGREAVSPAGPGGVQERQGEGPGAGGGAGYPIVQRHRNGN